MIDIYICEDIQKQRERIAYYVETAIMIEEYDMELKLATDDAGAFLQAVKKSKNTGLYFLDIDLGSGKNGLELAREIREYDPRGFIVFVTSHSEMSLLTFQYRWKRWTLSSRMTRKIFSAGSRSAWRRRFRDRRIYPGERAGC